MGVSAYDVIQANAFLGSQFLSQGKQFFVRPATGSDGADGRSPRKALKTLAAALAKCTANQNDVVWFMSEGNTSALCTDYGVTNWNKDGVHLIGVNSGVSISPRSRLALVSTYTGVGPLFTLSANNCRIANMAFYAGVASANPLGAVKVTGDRNRFERCHIAGIGHATMDVAGGYSLMLDGAEENEFDHCVIGTFTIARGAALNSQILFDTASKENLFENCRIVSQVSHASNHVLVEVADATGVDAFNYFKRCDFLYQSANYAVGATGVSRLPALTQGYLYAKDCGTRSDASGTTIKWDVNDRDKWIIVGAATPAADTTDVGRLV